jgi:8-oxo-dGTP pyrophosphatase MutT (NUDIX family)
MHRAGRLHARLAHESVDPPQAAAFMRAALRETEEECAVRVSIDAIEGWSRWITPRVPSMCTKRWRRVGSGAVGQPDSSFGTLLEARNHARPTTNYDVD